MNERVKLSNDWIEIGPSLLGKHTHMKTKLREVETEITDDGR